MQEKKYEPLNTVVQLFEKIDFPIIKYQSTDVRIGIVNSLYTLPTTGILFDAEISFEDESGKITTKNWRYDCDGVFFIGDYKQGTMKYREDCE